MARIDFNDFDKLEQRENSGSSNRVEFFNLRNDGDSAIVRFAISSKSDIIAGTVHTTTINGKQRKVSCLRTLNEPISNCPMCANSIPLQSRVFVKLVEYVRDDSGKLTPVGKVWERSISMGKILSSYIDDYGDLRDYLFKITRHGMSGDTNTTYDIKPMLNRDVYNDTLYVKDFSSVDSYNPIGTVVINTDRNGMLDILNGVWNSPKKEHQSSTSQTQTANGREEYPSLNTPEFSTNNAPYQPSSFNQSSYQQKPRTYSY